MRALRGLRSVFVLAAQRLWNNLGLMAGTAFGLVVAVALATSVPLYVDGVNERVLQQALAEAGSQSGRPPFAFMFRYLSEGNEPLAWSDYLRADRFFRAEAPGQVGLPLEITSSLVRTSTGRIYPASAAGLEERTAMDWVSLGLLDDMPAHIELVDGQLPSPAGATDAPVQVLVAEDKANEFGLMAGDEFNFVVSEAGHDYRLRLAIAGIWRPLDVTETYWFQNPAGLNSVFLVDEEAFSTRVVPSLGERPVDVAIWYQVYDGHQLHANDALAYLGRWVQAGTAAGIALPNVSIVVAPVDAVSAFAQASRLLTVLLYVFTLPIAAIVLCFISINAMLVVQRQRNEIAVLRSRGTSASQIAGLYLLEALILSAVAMAAGPLLGQQMAQVMIRTESFLTFGAGVTAPVPFSRQCLLAGAAAVVVAAASSILPALGAAQHTIVTYKQELVRSLRRPWWQVAWLDLWLLAVPLYGYYELKRRGTISFLGQNLVTAETDPFRNPLLFLVPTLFVFALALVFLRIFPLLMKGLATLVQYLPEISPLLALRQLERSWQHYTGPLFLLVLTLGLGCFTASMAKTLDQALYDRYYYATGADLRLVEMGEAGGASDGTAGLAGAPFVGGLATGGSAAETGSGFWSSLPVSEHTRVAGVLDAARVGSFVARLKLGDNEIEGTLLGVDRVDFSRVAYFRLDFVGGSLGYLMNLLARDDSAVLVPASLLAANGLAIGDRLTFQVFAGSQGFEVPATIAGVHDYFPLLYPDDGPSFVGNLDYLFERMGGEQPYDVLLRTEPGTQTAGLVTGLEDLGLSVLQTYDAQALIAKERERPERQGLLGLLSVGFLASSVLTVLGFLFYSFLSFRQRFIQLGMLRAIGLSVTQMVGFLALEQLVLIVTGIAAGTSLGVLASRLFIPFLQVQAGAHPRIPPFHVLVAWSDIGKIYIIFGSMLLVAVVGLAWFLVRMRIAEAVKLGETA